MKIFLVFFIIFFSQCTLIAHVKKEEGLFYKYVRYTSRQRVSEQNSVQREKKVDQKK